MVGPVLCSCESFLMICQQFCTNWEKCLLSGEFGVIIGRTVFGLAALGDL